MDAPERFYRCGQLDKPKGGSPCGATCTAVVTFFVLDEFCDFLICKRCLDEILRPPWHPCYRRHRSLGADVRAAHDARAGRPCEAPPSEVTHLPVGTYDHA